MSELQSRAFVRHRGALYPADPFAEELLAKIKDGNQVLVSIRSPRNIDHHRLLFAVLRKVVENSDRWADEQILLMDLKLATGLYTTQVNGITGQLYPSPASISFSAMSQDRFKVWSDKAFQVLAEAIGVTVEDLLSEASENSNPTVSVVRPDSDGGADEGSEVPPSTQRESKSERA